MFRYYQPTKLHFGAGMLQELGEICKPYGNRCLLVTTADEPLQPLYARVKSLLMKVGIEVVHFDQVEPNPSVQIVEKGHALLATEAVDFVLAVGGGSSIDTAKAITFTNGVDEIKWDDLFAYDSPFGVYDSYSRAHLPLLCVPTTSGTGSQVTQAAVLTRGKEKLTFFHSDNFVKECILDPQLMMTLPRRMSAATGFDAFTHAFESYINERASYYSAMDSMEAMRLVIENLPELCHDLENITLRTNLCLADTLAGRALANSGASAPHPLSEIIGGIAHVTHGEALAAVFPPFVRQMSEVHKDKFTKIASLFGTKDVYTGLCAFLDRISLHKTLKELGVSEGQFQEILASPILDHLPFGSRVELENILKEAYGC